MEKLLVFSYRKHTNIIHSLYYVSEVQYSIFGKPINPLRASREFGLQSNENYWMLKLGFIHLNSTEKCSYLVKYNFVPDSAAIITNSQLETDFENWP